MIFLQSLRDKTTLHSAIRFAAAIVIADALVWWIFREGTPVVMGSFAVICLLYFLDYEGTNRERLVGYTTAATIGLASVALGSLLSGPLWLAVAGAFTITFCFAYARVLKGYVARASVGLQGAFFLPLMAGVTPTEIPPMLASWLIGSAVAALAGMFILPKKRDGKILDLMRQWLTLAQDITHSPGSSSTSDTRVASLATVGNELAEHSMRAAGSLGMVGSHERALAHMVDGSQWGVTAFELLDEARPAGATPVQSTQLLLAESARAFGCARDALTQSPPPRDVPDMANRRDLDLHGAASLTDEQLVRHYPARLVSILAMRMLWLAGRFRGVAYPDPDIGSTADRTPLALLRLNFGWKSVWFANAIRTAASTAACVLLVRELGLDHGLWVVLAALSVTQVSFSATSNGTSSVRLAVGAMVGVAIASLAAVLQLPHAAFIVLLPVLAFLAVVAVQSGPFLAQSFYTPFALTNLAALQWATDRGLEVARVENISLGVAVAAAFALLVFPFGLSKQVARQITAADASSRAYLRAAISVARGDSEQEALESRKQCLRDVTELESTLSAAAIRPTLQVDETRAGRSTDTLARDRIIGGDACIDLGRHRHSLPDLNRVANIFADWWESSPLLTSKT